CHASACISTVSTNMPSMSKMTALSIALLLLMLVRIVREGAMHPHPPGYSARLSMPSREPSLRKNDAIPRFEVTRITVDVAGARGRSDANRLTMRERGSHH